MNIYNIEIEQFPAFILARRLHYQPHAFLEIPEELRQDVKMKFV